MYFGCFQQYIGEFGEVEQKLRDLASGEWKGKDLSHRVGSKQQKKRMQVPILEASASATVSILWQVDVGFYDELPWVQQQIVKGRYLHTILSRLAELC